MATTTDEILLAVDMMIGRMERLGISAWAGPVVDIGKSLAYDHGPTLLENKLNPVMHDAFAEKGWDAEFTGRGRHEMVKISRLQDPADHQTDWFLRHVHAQPGAVASLTDIRSSWYDYCVSRRVHLTKPNKEGITKVLDAAGFKRTRWTIDGVNYTGYKNVAVTFDEGSEYRPPTQAREVESEPVTEAESMRAMTALAGMAASVDLEKAHADLTGQFMMLCTKCGRLSLTPTHKVCRLKGK